MKESGTGKGFFWFAVVTVFFTFCLIGIGGLVTSREVGLAVYDWPTSFGYNMFLLPIDQWLGKFGVFEELTLHCKDEKIGKDCSNIISEKVHAEANVNPNWKEDPQSIAIIQLAIKDTLSEHPKEFSEELVEKLYDLARRLL